MCQKAHADCFPNEETPALFTYDMQVRTGSVLVVSGYGDKPDTICSLLLTWVLLKASRG